MNETLSQLDRWKKGFLGIGIVFLVLGAIAGARHSEGFFVSYLFAYVFWFGLTLGCFNAAMIHYLTGGRWGNVTRRFLEAGFMTLPLMALLFVPLLFGLHELYPWAKPESVAADKILQQKAGYENATGFLLRTVLFFVVWISIAGRLRRWSLRQDNSADVTPTVRLRALSGPANVIVPLTATFAFVDWIMSTEAAWFSTVFGVILLAGQLLAAFAWIILLLAWFRSRSPFRETVVENHFHDLGNLLLTFVMFWTYVAFSQFLIIYSGDQPHEITWYLHRIAGNWKWLVALIAVFHFLAPFFLLLFRQIKQNIAALATIAALVFVAHAGEIFWMIAPTFYPNGLRLHWTDPAAWIGIGGIWTAIFIGNLKRHPLLPLNNPLDQKPVTQTVDAG
jgi:hypothetical protein